MSGKTGEAEQLTLFDVGGIDLRKLRETLERLRVVVRAPLTLHGYAADWVHFERWCARVGRETLPATADTVALYVSWLLTEAQRKTTTASRHVCAIAHYHRVAKLPNPVPHGIRSILSAVRRERKEKPKGKRALSIDTLVEVARGCDTSTNAGSRDRALIVLGFASSLRRSDLSRLNLADVSFETKGLAVLVRYSKTDQGGKGRLIGVWAGRRATTDPVRVLRGWITKRGNWPGPLFPRITKNGDTILRRGISGEAINEIVKRAVARAGIDASEYGAHSLRAGAVTASAELGRSDQEIMDLSGHANAAVMRSYVRHGRVFAGRNPLAGIL
jgi:integrase